MIGFVRGVVSDKSQDRVIIDVAGVGYEVLVTNLLFDELVIGEETTLLTHDHIKESSRDLYGFRLSGEKELFEMLLSVSGIGPKGALAIMALGPHEQIRQAVASGNSAYLAGANGVGKKSAEKTCIELKDKVGVIGTKFVEDDSSDDARQALMALGYSASQAVMALAKIDSKLSSEERVKLALKEL
jgi:Holliday junction DNA helicase RuvA